MKSAIQATDIKNLAENGRGLQVVISATRLIHNMRRFPESPAANLPTRSPALLRLLEKPVADQAPRLCSMNDWRPFEAHCRRPR
jgi:hypothetical protein